MTGREQTRRDAEYLRVWGVKSIADRLDALLAELEQAEAEIRRLREDWDGWQRQALAAEAFVDLTLRCPVCGRRADMCFAHGDDWKKRPASQDRSG